MNEAILSKIKKFFQCDHIVPVGSGTAGLCLTMRSLNVLGKKVIIPSVMCPNVAIAVMAAGGIPTVVDVSTTDGNISIDSVKDVMDDSVKVIIAVNSFGYPVDMDGLKRLTTPFDCTIIDDACQAYGGIVDGNAVGHRGDIGVISFGYAKPISLMGGGFLLIDSKDIFERIKQAMTTDSFRRATLLKNWVSLRLPLFNQYRMFRYLSSHFGLLEYEFPEKSGNQFPEAWDAFEKDLKPIQSNLMRAADFIAKIDDFDTFQYTKEGWLPWRYSFKIPDLTAQIRFRRIAGKIGLSFSRLYKPLDRYFQELAGPDESTRPAATRLSHSIFNLRHETNLKSTEDLLSKLSSLHRHW